MFCTIQNSQPCISWPASQAKGFSGDHILCTFHKDGKSFQYPAKLTSGLEIYLKKPLRTLLNLRLGDRVEVDITTA